MLGCVCVFVKIIISSNVDVFSAQEETGTQTLCDGSDDTERGVHIKEHTLWVDEYSPKLFTELLSDDVSAIMLHF